MKTTYRTLFGLLLMTAAVTGISSCVYDKDDNPGLDKSGGLVLNLRTTSVGSSETTRATQITDGTTGTALTTGEKTVTNLVYGLFDADDSYNKLDAKNITSGLAAFDGSNQSQTTTSANYAGGAKTPADGDSVIVALNISSTPASSMAGAATKDAFKQVALTIDDALDYDGNGATEPAHLPMMGSGTVTYNGTTFKWETDEITVRHLVSKVTLGTLAVDFSSSTHTAATFKPTEIFLYNVPEKIDLQTDATAPTAYYGFMQGAIANYYTGETGETEAKAYLTTGTTIADVTMSSSTTTYGTAYTLYTLPNNSNTSKTKLVIKGTYSSDGQAWNAHTAYYGIELGKATSDIVQANKHYVLNVTIKGDGATSAAETHPTNIQDMDVTVTVLDFEDQTVTATYALSGEIAYTGIEPKMNPLWWVAEYNLNSDGTFASTNASANGYLYTWAGIMGTKWAAQSTSYDGWQIPTGTGKTAADRTVGDIAWHMPTQQEYLSIVPNTANFFAAGDSPFKVANTGSPSAADIMTEPACVFGYNAATQTATAYKSYWSGVTSNTRYAIRFIGTEFCSVWKYQFAGGKLTITSKLIDKIEESNVAGLAAKMIEITGGGYDWTTLTEDKGEIQREFFACGYNAQNNPGNAPGSSYSGAYGYYWSATQDGSLVRHLLFYDGYLYVNSNVPAYPFSVRLFRDE